MPDSYAERVSFRMAPLWSLGMLLAGLFLLQTDGVHADGEEPLGSPFLQRSVREAIEQVDKAYKETRANQKERLSKRSLRSSDLLRFFKHPMAETRIAVRSAEYMESTLRLIQHHVHRVHKRSLNASDLLTPSDLNTIAEVTGCRAIRQPPICKDDCWSNRYRTFTAVCNNRMHPRLGSSNTALTRWLPARYEDGISLPLGWTPGKRVSRYTLPLVRAVSNKILKTSNENVPLDLETTNLFMQWGQWIDHDMSLSDVRVNEQLGVLTFHTVFLREHNRLTRELKRLNPHWSGDTTYLEARKILGAFQQIINHRDYLPLVIGPAATAKYLPAYKGYDESVNPSIANVFSTAVFRFGHLSIQPKLFRFGANYQEHPQFKNMDLHQTFFSPWRLIREGGVDPIMRGLLGKPSKLQTQNKMLPDELREKLFKLTAHLAMDLGSLNLQRSRDHGIPGYNAWRRFCGLSQPKNAYHLFQVLKNRLLTRKLMALYRTPDNIDVWMGGISEPFVKGGKVGPLFACLMGQQFKNLRDGDRFWWENKDIFTVRQRSALAEISMSRIICDNTGIQFLPRDAFKFETFPRGYVNCNQIPKVDLRAWKEDVQVTPCGSIPVVDHGHFSICKSSVRYTCESGFKLVGGDTLTCLSNGQWNIAPPGCEEPQSIGSQVAQNGIGGPTGNCSQPIPVSLSAPKKSAFSAQLNRWEFAMSYPSKSQADLES
ncbi:hypothetical protein scyTo_0014169 [Scyliorhinus torazame]|uniref:Sushi domain-containing protein n=1 Tax=Scyliorhinus torazame TaxID=75743 RepID=A0A401NHT1_SCYTO|nr:hypothetical protein [Scyliorhinus torazame]